MGPLCPGVYTQSVCGCPFLHDMDGWDGTTYTAAGVVEGSYSALEKGIKFAAFFFLRPQLSFRDIFWESRASQLGTTPPFSFLATLQAA
jgi:hypothetical protein